MRKILSLLIAVVLGVSTAFATTVYCKMTYGWWTQDDAAVAVHYWGGESAGTSWPGVRMEAVTGDEGAWSYDVPADVEGLMFVRVNGSGDIVDWGAKTVNLTLPTDGKNLFTITNESESWGDPGCNGEWSVYGEEPAPQPDPTAPYTMFFTYYNSTSGDGSAKLTTAAAIFDEASQVYVAKVDTGIQVYAGRKYKDGNDSIFSNLKLGSSSAAGEFKFILANPTEVDSIIFRAAMYANNEGGEGFKVNGTNFTLSAGKLAFENKVWTPTGVVDTIDLVQNKVSKGRFFLTSITIYPKAGETPEPPVEDPAKFYITGDAALLGESLAWNPAAIKVTEDSYTFENLAAGDYKLKVTLDGTWGDGMVKGFSDLTIVADGLTADGDGNICFTLAEAGNVEVTYTAEAFTLAGNFYVEPQPQGCDWDNIEFLGDGSPEQTFGSQFKICMPEGMSVVNIQKPGFASESGIYVTFPSAAFGTISLPESAYDIQGAGMILHCSAFTEEYTEVTVNCEGNDIVFTVYNAAAAPQPVEHTYTVAGNSAAIFGAEWNPGNTAADMTLVEGIYTFVKEEVELVAGNIEFKVCEDHAWTTAYPAQNYQLAIPVTGIYTISITFNPDSKEVAAVANKTGDAEIDPTVSVKGGWDSWAAEVAFTLADNKESATGVLNLEAGNYEFKVILNGSDWRSNGYTYHREFTGAENITGNGDNMVLQADAAGEYTITWTFANNAIAIAFPTATAISNTAADVEAVKVLHNGMLLIRKGNKTYTIMGQAVK
jgi:hypothetical protein